MCGIVGLYLKNDKYQENLGALFAPMLIAMSERGPDSAGFALYGNEVADRVKVTLRHDDAKYDWAVVQNALSDQLAVPVDMVCFGRIAVLVLAAEELLIRTLLATIAPDSHILSIGQSIEIFKEVGLPKDVSESFQLTTQKGSHIIGHTRMATESAVTMAGSHPFSTGQDLCLVHNGSLSNHNRLRIALQRHGIHFETDNDSEVAAGYLAWRLQSGDTLEQALEHALQDLDGFFTFAIGSKDGFAVVRDPIACKPAVIAETDDYVAMASEYQALTSLPDIDKAKVWEPF